MTQPALCESILHIQHAIAIAVARGLQVDRQEDILFLQRGHASASLRFEGTHLRLGNIEVDATQRNKRFGTKMLQDVISIADQMQMTIHLFVHSSAYEDEPGLQHNDLMAWYQQFGFSGQTVRLRRQPTRPVSNQ